MVKKKLENKGSTYCIKGLEKAFDRIDREALWDVLMVYQVEVKLLNAVTAIYTCINVNGETGDRFLSPERERERFPSLYLGSIPEGLEVGGLYWLKIIRIQI